MFLQFDSVIRAAATWLWGPPMLIFLFVVGLYFSLRLKGIQFMRLVQSAKLTFTTRKSTGEGNITPWQSLQSVLGGMIGNGNLAGVATAIAIGGPGAIFWMWISGFVGMIINYSEVMLGMIYRKKGEDGVYVGGPMYYIEKVLKIKWLAVLFALAMGLKTLLATSTVQSNSISIAVNTQFGVSQLLTCVILAILTWIVIIGGLRTIAVTMEKLTPLMVVIYLFAVFAIIISDFTGVTEVFKLIFKNAFTPAGASGGFAGTTVLMAVRYGVARGFYSNEAGTGSAPILYSTTMTDSPQNQSLIGMFSVFIDTMIVNTLTAVVIILTGVWNSGETSSALTVSAFSTLFGSWGGWVVCIASFLFGLTTLITWSFYGEQCFAYVFGIKVKKLYRWLFCLAILGGAVKKAELIWSWGDLLNGITVIINVVVLVLILKIVVKWSFNKGNDVQK